MVHKDIVADENIRVETLGRKVCQLHIGANGVPLSYMIRENEEPDINSEHPDFINKRVACAQLEGRYPASESMSV